MKSRMTRIWTKNIYETREALIVFNKETELFSEDTIDYFI